MWLLLACTASPGPKVEAPTHSSAVDTALDTPDTGGTADTDDSAMPEERVLVDDGVAYVAAEDVHADLSADGGRDALIQVDDGVWVVDPVPADSVGLLASAVATIVFSDGGHAASGDVDGDTRADVVLSRVNPGDPLCELQTLVWAGPIGGALDADGRTAELVSATCFEGETVRPMVARDLDGDGADELLHVIIDGHGGPSTLYRLPLDARSFDTRTTSEWFAVTEDVVSDAMLGGEAALGPGDMDGDGAGDLFIGRMLLSGPIGEGDTLTDGPWLTGPGDDGACAGDVDGDGYMDVVLTAGDRVSMVPGPLVDGDWTSLATWTAWTAADGPSVATTCDDADGDTRTDVILTAAGVWAFAGPLSGAVDLGTEPPTWAVSAATVASAAEGEVLLCDGSVPECRVWGW